MGPNKTEVLVLETDDRNKVLRKYILSVPRFKIARWRNGITINRVIELEGSSRLFIDKSLFYGMILKLVKTKQIFQLLLEKLKINYNNNVSSCEPPHPNPLILALNSVNITANPLRRLKRLVSGFDLT